MRDDLREIDELIAGLERPKATSSRRSRGRKWPDMEGVEKIAIVLAVFLLPATLYTQSGAAGIAFGICLLVGLGGTILEGVEKIIAFVLVKEGLPPQTKPTNRPCIECTYYKEGLEHFGWGEKKVCARKITGWEKDVDVYGTQDNTPMYYSCKHLRRYSGPCSHFTEILTATVTHTDTHVIVEGRGKRWDQEKGVCNDCRFVFRGSGRHLCDCPDYNNKRETNYVRGGKKVLYCADLNTGTCPHWKYKLPPNLSGYEIIEKKG